MAGALVTAQGRSPGRTPPADAFISVTDGVLTARVRRQPLGVVLNDIGSRAGVALTVAADIESDLISGNVEKLPLDEGLRRLFIGYDAFFYYTGTEGGRPKLTAAWIYPKGTALAMRPALPGAVAVHAELKALAADRDPAVREKAYEALISRPDPEGYELIVQAIRGQTESDPGVRQRILSAAVTRGMHLPMDLLRHLIIGDPSEDMRSMALDALAAVDGFADNPEVTVAAEAALSDSSAAVRQRAQQILADIVAARQKP